MLLTEYSVAEVKRKDSNPEFRQKPGGMSILGEPGEETLHLQTLQDVQVPV